MPINEKVLKQARAVVNDRGLSRTAPGSHWSKRQLTVAYTVQTITLITVFNSNKMKDVFLSRFNFILKLCDGNYKLLRLSNYIKKVSSTTLNTWMTVPGLKQLVLPAWHIVINMLCIRLDTILNSLPLRLLTDKVCWLKLLQRS